MLDYRTYALVRFRNIPGLCSGVRNEGITLHGALLSWLQNASNLALFNLSPTLITTSSLFPKCQNKVPRRSRSTWSVNPCAPPCLRIDGERSLVSTRCVQSWITTPPLSLILIALCPRKYCLIFFSSCFSAPDFLDAFCCPAQQSVHVPHWFTCSHAGACL